MSRRDPSGRDTKADFAAVRKVLWENWDPIGGVPEDEYDGYVWPILAILYRGGSREVVADYLRWGADVHITLPVPEEKLAGVLDALMAHIAR